MQPLVGGAGEPRKTMTDEERIIEGLKRIENMNRKRGHAPYWHAEDNTGYKIKQRLAIARHNTTRKDRTDMKKNDPITVQEGSGNVFADLDLPNSEQDQIKAELTLQIYRIIKKRNLTQAEAGKILGIKQPYVSALMRNRPGHFSVGRLMEFLTALGQDVEINVKPAGRINPHGVVSVLVH